MYFEDWSNDKSAAEASLVICHVISATKINDLYISFNFSLFFLQFCQ